MIQVEKKKMGRPTTDPKTYETRVRMSESDVKKIEYCKKETGKTKADIIRMGIDKVYQELKK